jgi:hypothetical protein
VATLILHGVMGLENLFIKIDEREVNEASQILHFPPEKNINNLIEIQSSLTAF